MSVGEITLYYIKGKEKVVEIFLYKDKNKVEKLLTKSNKKSKKINLVTVTGELTSVDFTKIKKFSIVEKELTEEQEEMFK